jgi:hypothetical protein
MTSHGAFSLPPSMGRRTGAPLLMVVEIRSFLAIDAFC